MKQRKNHIFPLAVCIVMSGMFKDDLDKSEEVICTGQGGHDLLGNKHQIKDQKLEHGNLALKNNSITGAPVRVVCGHESKSSFCGKVYTYDGLYKIIDNKCIYTVDGDVYFSIDNFPDYCCLSRRKLDDNHVGGRVTVDVRKKNPADFASWKSAKPGEPSCDSPWGRVRPGWHIECSAMSSHYSFDIHGGGMDLIFPHHENEIAQSRAACPESKVNYWMHNGFVNQDNQKMSKSDNYFFTICEGKQQQRRLFQDPIVYEKVEDVLGFLGLMSSSA